MAPIVKLTLPLGKPESRITIKARQNSASPPFVAVTSSTTTLAPTQTFLPTPTPTISNPGTAPSPLPPNNDGPLIGGVIGGFLGTLLLIFLLWKGCWDPQLNYRRSSRYGSDDSDDSDDDSSGSSGSSRVRRRGGGGEEFRMHSHPHDTSRSGGDIKRPARVYSRRERDRDRMGRGSYRYRSRRRSGDFKTGSSSTSSTSRGPSSKVLELRAGGILGRPVYKQVTRRDLQRWKRGTSHGYGYGYGFGFDERERRKQRRRSSRRRGGGSGRDGELRFNVGND